MAQVVKTPLEASVKTIEAKLGCESSECEWNWSKHTNRLPLCLFSEPTHFLCEKHLHNKGDKICCLCWSHLDYRRELLNTCVQQSKLKVVERETVV